MKFRALLPILITALGVVVSPWAAASELGLDFNNHAFNAYGSFSLNPRLVGAQADLNAGYLYDGRSKHDTLNFGHVGAIATGDFGVPGARVGVGARIFAADRDGDTGAGAALGGSVDYHPPSFDRFDVGGYLFYGPDVLVGGDFRHYLEYGVDAGYQVIRNATVYVGYRRLELPLHGAPASRSDTASEGWHVGLRVGF